MEANERKNVAVIGTGMAGLVVAYMLRNDPRGRFDVEVFEKVKKTPPATLHARKLIPTKTHSKTNFRSTPRHTTSQTRMAEAKRLNASIFPCAHSPTDTTKVSSACTIISVSHMAPYGLFTPCRHYRRMPQPKPLHTTCIPRITTNYLPCDRTACHGSDG